MSVALYVVRNEGQFTALDDEWTDALAEAAHFLSPVCARLYAASPSEVVKVEYADDWAVISQEVVK